jgi:glycosyltransferase involved in cell wall biosynthesis
MRVFLSSHIDALARQSDVSVALNAAPDKFQSNSLNARLFNVPIERKISPLRDLQALTRLVFLFRQNRFDIVHSVTPKVGLLAMTAAWLARVPVRINTFTGQTWATRKGLVRTLLRAIDGLIARLATHVLVDSPSQREFLIANGVVAASKSAVLAEGSICGVDGGRFRPDLAVRDRVRSALGIPHDTVLFLFLGRLGREKGVLDLAAAFAVLAERHPEAYLLIAGPDEEGIKPRMLALLAACTDRVRWIDYTDRPEEYMAAADVFCLPSYREGFGQVAIEASATELPVVASRIYGLSDAVLHGQTGLLHAPGNVEALCEHMETLLTQPELRGKLRRAGRARALSKFSAERVTQALLDYYSAIARTL